jgi:CheY-like chemotaxis protein
MGAIEGRTPAAAELTLLLVDDDEAVLRCLGQMVSSLGFRVVSAASAEEALVLAATEPVHLLVCDVALPRLSGYELAGSLSERSPGLATLFISGYSRDALRDRYGDAGNALHLAKPFRLGALAEALTVLVEARARLAA